MAREELVSSAVSFLQDPSVASSPLEKRVAFLQSKNLTQEEIDLALSRASGESAPSGTVTPSTSSGYSQPQQNAGYRPPPPPPNQGYAYGPYGQWQPPPPELPKRDWRDWFIMATVMGGVGYGLYFVTKRYISPLIAPPTPPQIQQDKESIDEQFSRAFGLLDQLSTDTANLKSAEEARTEHIDSTLREVENVVSELKTASRRRDDETRRISDEIKELKDRIPKAMEGAREGNEKRLKELGSELRSLKVLVGNRVGGASAVPGASRPASGVSAHAPTRSSEDAGSAVPATSGTPSQQASVSNPTPATPAPSALPAASQGSGSSFSQLGKPAAIPAWQMAAANRANNSTSTSSQNNTVGNSSGTTDTNEKQEASAS
ncbi:peroxisomal membrane protein pex14 [Arachnomyces sp. PD_36]|nr:peroxisomal membrane protein pex14 [Arachnomyces sp. PD_36]